MRILKKILFILAIIFLVIAAVGFIFFPSHCHVERSTVINQKPDVVFNYVNNLKNWNNWSPWYKKDTTAVYTYDGIADGRAWEISWVSKVKDVGTGSIKILESSANSSIKEDLSFMGEGHAEAAYAFVPEGDGTKMTWSFDSEMGANPLMRIMGGLMMDKFLGKEFEQGLGDLKKIMETMPAPAQPADSLSQQPM